MSSVGIFAGTFDPVHDGHIAFALAAAKTERLPKVYFLPEHQPRAKQNASDFKNRLALLQDALRPYKNLEVLELDEPNFSIATTIPKLKSHFPGAVLNFLMGSDAGYNLPKWQGIEDVLPEVNLIIGLRAGDDEPSFMKFLAEHLPQAQATIIASPQPHLSSSSLRAKNEQP